MPTSFDLLRDALLWLQLLTCPDTPTDLGGVRCVSTAAAELRPPWRGRESSVSGGAFLRRTARAESGSRPIGVHAGDARGGRGFWEAATRTGWLSPRWCPGHVLTAGGPRGRGWAPRGAWGVAAAYGLRHLGIVGCLFGPALLDVPALGALAAASHLQHCSRVRRTRDADELRMCWAGGRKRRADVLRRWREVR